MVQALCGQLANILSKFTPCVSCAYHPKLSMAWEASQTTSKSCPSASMASIFTPTCLFQTDPAFLAIGTSVSAKYKGAFCEAKVKSVAKQVKCRVTFKQDLGSTTLSDEHVKSLDDSPLQAGATVLARHPDKQTFLEATLNKIQVQSDHQP